MGNINEIGRYFGYRSIITEFLKYFRILSDIDKTDVLVFNLPSKVPAIHDCKVS